MNANKIAVDHDMVCCGWNFGARLAGGSEWGGFNRVGCGRVGGGIEEGVEDYISSLRIRG